MKNFNDESSNISTIEDNAYVFTYSVSVIINEVENPEEELQLMKDELEHIGFIVDNMMYEEI